MSSFHFPSERSSSYNPKYYIDNGSGEVTQAELDQKLNRSNDTAINVSLQNASFTGGMIETRLQAQDVTSGVKLNLNNPGYGEWDANTSTYFDFSDPTNIAKDVTGKGHHGTVRGELPYASDPTRTHVLKFPLNVAPTQPSITCPGIDMDAHTSALFSPTWSVSIWFKLGAEAAGKTGQKFTLLSMAKTPAIGASATATFGQLYVEQHGLVAWYPFTNGVGSTAIWKTANTVNPFVWNHVVLTVGATNTTIYVNGITDGTSVSGHPSVRTNPVALGMNTCTIGAHREETTAVRLVDKRNGSSFCGLISDVSMYTRELSAADVGRLFADDYGHQVYIMAGQSNMGGDGIVVPGIDDDYSVLQGRVNQYDSRSNLTLSSTTTWTATGNSIIPATVNIRHVPTSQSTLVGMWRTFAGDLVAFGNIPWRRRVLLVPCGWPATSFAAGHWRDNGSLNNITIVATNSAMGTNPMNVLSGFLWLQGESDVAALNMTYRADFDAMMARFQAQITGFTTSTRVVLGEISQRSYENTFYTGVTPNVHMLTKIRADMDAIVAASPTNYRLVGTKDLATAEGTHWGSPALRTIGSRFFDALGSMKECTRVPSVTVPGEFRNAAVFDPADYTSSAGNVKNFGAVGDGIHDDTAAIVAAFAGSDISMVYFPQGTYKITSEILVQSKPGMGILSDNAVIVQTLAAGTETGVYCFRIVNCDGFAIVGRLTLKSSTSVNIRPALVTSGTGNGLYTSGCSDACFDNLTILGPFLIGITLQTAGSHRVRSLSRLAVSNCVRGVEMLGEYYQINDSFFTYNRTAVYIQGGNNSVVSSHINLNRIGIHVAGGIGNSDHGKIIGCTINHNIACGVYIVDTRFSFHVTGCDIWAQIGDYPNTGFLPTTLTEVANTSAATNAFGVYLQNVENINFTANTVARNTVNLGLDGYVVCGITGNSFPTDPGRTTGQIVEYGGSHDQYNRNAQNVIEHNLFYGALLGGTPTTDKRIQFWNNTGTSSNDDSTIACRNNRGTTGQGHWLNLSASGGSTADVVFDPNYEYMLLNVTNSAAVKLHSAFAGSSFEIIISGITSGQTKYVELASAATFNGAGLPTIVGAGCAYDAPTKRYTFSVNGSYSFVPNGAMMNYWNVFCPAGAATAASVGLGSVDNTSDAAKPVSTAQATALAAKADLTTVTALSTTVGTLVSDVGVLTGYNSVLALTASSTTISVGTELPNIIFADISAGSKTVYLPTLSGSYPRNYSGRTFVVHCHDNATSSGNSLTVRAGSSSQYLNQFGTTISTGRALTPGSVQRYYTMNGLYYEI